MGKKKIVQKASSGEAAAGSTAAAARGRGKKLPKLGRARIYVNSSYNNTVVSVTDLKGNMLTWATAGSLGFSGPKKATPFAASKVIAVVVEKLSAMETKELEIFVKGVGGGRDSAIRSLANHGFEISLLRDVTPIPHNGPRPPKPRRV